MLKLIGLALFLISVVWTVVITGDNGQPRILSLSLKFAIRSLFAAAALCLFFGVWYHC